MNNSFENLKSNIEDIRALFALSTCIGDIDQERIILRSLVVLLVASWELFVEQLADGAIAVMVDRLRDPSPIPDKVKESIAVNTVPENRGNLKGFSDSVWSFADKGWKIAYQDYCNKLTSNLHNASTQNIIALFWKILGIRNITQEWNYLDISNEECVDKIDDIINLRHDIAHGANTRNEELNGSLINDYINFVTNIAKQTFFIIYDKTAELSQSQGIEYKLNQAGLKKIIAFAAKSKTETITIAEIKSLGSSAYGNHNKLCYQPWSLLEKIDSKTRRVTDKLHQFYKNELSLPLRILVFDNGEAIAKPNTENITNSDL